MAQADVFDEIQSRVTGIVLVNTTIFSDTTFTAPTRNYFQGGSLVTVLKESHQEHEDDAQKQLYKWYLVKNEAGKKGWVFGDGLLLKEKDELLSRKLKPFAYKKYRFNGGFENSMVWFGSIIGRDNFGSQMLGNNYVESYMIITNQLARSIYIPISNSSQFGQSEVESFAIQELTGDQTPEIMLQIAIIDMDNEASRDSDWQPQKVVNVYTFQAGTLRKVFEERLNTGSQYKHLIFEKGMIRGHYFETAESITGLTKDPQLFSFTYFWNKRNRQYEMLYSAAPAALRAVPNTYGLNLKASTVPTAATLAPLRTTSQLRIVDLTEIKTIERGKTYVKTCAEVVTDKGQRGFVPFEYLSFPDFDNADWIKASLLNTRLETEAISCVQLPEIAADTSSVDR